MQKVWDFLLELPLSCSHPPLPANETGLEVLVAGITKSGTRTICHALNDIGIRAYHSEDFFFWSVWDWSSNRWKQRGVTSYEAPIVTLLPAAPHADEELAAAISKCRVKAVALDGLELFFEPLYRMSAGAKVILLDWRSFEEFRRSWDNFMPKLALMCYFNIYSTCSLSVLPWGALLRVLDPLVGSPLAQTIREGGPPLCEVCGPMMWSYCGLFSEQRQYRSWKYSPASNHMPETEAEYIEWHAAVKRLVPSDRLMSWNHKKNTFEDLCAFLGVEPCPRRGRLPRALNTWLFERDFPIAGAASLVVKFFFHWVNWRLFCGARSAVQRYRAAAKARKSD